MKDRLQWILEQLQRLQDSYQIRTEGESTFNTAKNELVDVIANYVDAVAPPPAIVYQAMTAEQLAAQVVAITAAVQAESADSDVTVLAAIEGARADLLAALTPA